jgi:hypothetical protein
VEGKGMRSSSVFREALLSARAISQPIQRQHLITRSAEPGGNCSRLKWTIASGKITIHYLSDLFRGAWSFDLVECSDDVFANSAICIRERDQLRPRRIARE